jgi:hypothetical protein
LVAGEAVYLSVRCVFIYDTGNAVTWNKLNELNMIATLKLCAVRVYVTKASVAARTGSEVASAKLCGLN